MSTKTFAKGDLVNYRTQSGTRVEAIVRAAHRDGSYTVEARFFFRADGTPCPGYIGHRYLMAANDLTAPPRSPRSGALDELLRSFERLTPTHRQLVTHLARVLEPQTSGARR
jgi:hypothetical protein